MTPVGAVTKTMPPFDRQLLQQAAEEFGLRLVVLYGSWAKWERPPGPESDVDIAVFGCPTDRFWDCYKALSRVFEPAMVDMVRLESADPLFRHEIMHRGVLLCGDPDLFCEYRAFAYRDFTDSADLLALEDALYRKKMDYLRRQLYASS